MSEDVKTKRVRLVENKPETQPKKENDKLAYLENANVAPEKFDWDAHQASCPSRSRKINKGLKNTGNHNVYSHEPYAQDFLNLLNGYEETKPVQMKIEVGEIYTGNIYSINEEWVSVDIGYRENVYVNVLKEEASVRGLFVPDAEVKIQVIQIEGGRGFVLGSISAGIKSAVAKEIMASIEEGTTGYMGTVSYMIPGGGYIVTVQGIECFMPGSLAGINKLADFESIVGSDMYVVPVSFSEKRGTIVVSHREYLKAMIPSKIDALKENLGQDLTGKVTGSAKYGVFVEFDECLTGMIHVNDLTPELLKAHRSREIKPGDDIAFKIKEVVSNEKIILTQLDAKPVVDLWDGISERIKTPSEVVGTVRAVKDYGIFVDIEKGVAGLLHISEIEDVIDLETIKPGDKITVQVTRIDADSRKIFLKI
jgi:small subunit ribosomal protein S1|tara:strand:- start:380 stop:1648 length:1269 start_codon:yes stop_codon:yes gene_type:complete